MSGLIDDVEEEVGHSDVIACAVVGGDSCPAPGLVLLQGRHRGWVIVGDGRHVDVAEGGSRGAFDVLQSGQVAVLSGSDHAAPLHTGAGRCLVFVPPRPAWGGGTVIPRCAGPGQVRNVSAPYSVPAGAESLRRR